MHKKKKGQISPKKWLFHILLIGSIFLISVYNAISYYELRYKLKKLKELNYKLKEKINEKKVKLLEETTPQKLQEIAKKKFNINFTFNPEKIYTIELTEQEKE